MTPPGLKELLGSGVLLLDGAMGTQLIARGIAPGGCNDCLNVESPDIIADIHRSYLEAGSDAVLTNTFGANRFVLARHGRADQVRQMNKAGAQLARRAAGPNRFVLGDVGPCGDFLQPLGSVDPADLRAAFTDQAQALLDANVDGFVIETMTALDELEIAVGALQAVAGDLPVLASVSFDRVGEGFRTMMGIDVPSAVEKMLSLGVNAVGFNCGMATLDEYVALACEYVAVVRSAGSDVTVFAEPNAGKPELVDGQATYRVTPDEFADAAERLLACGVRVLGGCCGTGPEFIEAVARRAKQ